MAERRCECGADIPTRGLFYCPTCWEKWVEVEDSELQDD